MHFKLGHKVKAYTAFSRKYKTNAPWFAHSIPAICIFVKGSSNVVTNCMRQTLPEVLGDLDILPDITHQAVKACPCGCCWADILVLAIILPAVVVILSCLALLATQIWPPTATEHLQRENNNKWLSFSVNLNEMRGSERAAGLWLSCQRDE